MACSNWLSSSVSRWGTEVTTTPYYGAFSIAGDLFRRYKYTGNKALIAIKVAAGLSIAEPLAAWNDAPERTFADVRALVERLGI